MMILLSNFIPASDVSSCLREQTFFRVKAGLFTAILLLLLFLMPGQTRAQTGLEFINIGPNAHSLSFSEAHTAVALGSNSIFSNPANLMLSDQSSLGVSYTLWIGDTQHTQASAAVRRENDSFAIGVLSSVVDDISLRNVPGPEEGSFSVQYFALSGGYARQVSFLSLGVSGTYLYEQLFQQNANGFGFSFGSTGSFMDKRLRIGSAITNMGRMSELDVQRSTVPTRWRSGLDINAVQLSSFGGTEVPLLINFSADYILPLAEDELENNETVTGANVIESSGFVALGMEAELYDVIALRGGYRSGDTVRSWSFGAGINVEPVEFHYAFVPFETGFGSVHSISLQYFFDF